ncbi:hypothetical protein [Spirosoma flavum]|uniref:DUF1735 domain-containing protein n=1 Tax=Spirosoma flavum TaxID=2048557 RepID=A0ABW6ASC7_9BACT
MKTQTLSLFLLLAITACHQNNSNPAPNDRPYDGTYEIYRLVQYQDNQVVLDGFLPYTTMDSSILTKRVSVDIYPENNYATPVSLAMGERTNSAKSQRVVVNSLSSTLTYARPVMDGHDFYQNDTVKVGHSSGSEINFDIAKKDSAGHTIRYIFRAKKVDLSGHF